MVKWPVFFSIIQSLCIPISYKILLLKIIKLNVKLLFILFRFDQMTVQENVSSIKCHIIISINIKRFRMNVIRPYIIDSTKLWFLPKAPSFRVYISNCGLRSPGGSWADIRGKLGEKNSHFVFFAYVIEFFLEANELFHNSWQDNNFKFRKGLIKFKKRKQIFWYHIIITFNDVSGVVFSLWALQQSQWS